MDGAGIKQEEGIGGHPAPPIPSTSTNDKTSNGLHTFFLYQGYHILFFGEAHCTLGLRPNCALCKRSLEFAGQLRTYVKSEFAGQVRT